MLSDHALCQAAIGLVLLEIDSSPFAAAETPDPFNPFSFGCGTRVNGNYDRKISLMDGDKGADRQTQHDHILYKINQYFFNMFCLNII